MDKNITEWMRYSVSSRIIIVGVLAFLLLIPTEMVKNLVHERESAKSTAVSEISQKWGGPQIIAGPVLSVPYKRYFISEKGERVSAIGYAHFLPETLLIDGDMEPEIRSRGIFDTVVYSSKIKFSGKFTATDIRALGIKDEDADWSKAFVAVGISDTRGIEDNLTLRVNNAEIPFQPGVPTGDVFHVNAQTSGISAILPASINRNADGYEFSLAINLKGSQDLQFIPAGKTTEVVLRSKWNAPSFSGAFLPDTREVSNSGFHASWKILDLNRGYPQSWIGNTYDVYPSAFGVNLLVGIDGYTKTVRSAKYALLLIALTFLTFFFAEVFNRKKIHPIQYILVGLALVLFYALLVSLSEIIGFGFAYLASSVATIGLIALYSKSVLHTKMALAQFFILAFLYLFIYIILQLEDYALLVGSIFLFLILATVMYVSRKVDWYAVGGDTRKG